MATTSSEKPSLRYKSTRIAGDQTSGPVRRYAGEESTLNSRERAAAPLCPFL